jgi:hypothetical protein
MIKLIDILKENKKVLTPYEVRDAILVEYPPTKAHIKQLLAFMKDKTNYQNITSSKEATQAFSNYLREN